MGEVWTFQDPENDRLYRCEVDPDGSERWFFKVIRTESESISQSDAARLIGVSRQAIRDAIVWKRLGRVECNGRPMVSRAEVLALKIDLNGDALESYEEEVGESEERQSVCNPRIVWNCWESSSKHFRAFLNGIVCSVKRMPAGLRRTSRMPISQASELIKTSQPPAIKKRLPSPEKA